MSNNTSKEFPEYFSNFKLPDLSREQELDVFRALATGEIDKLSFQNTYEENGYEVKDGCDIHDPSQYSLSTYTKFKDVKRFMTMTSKYNKPFKIAKGITSANCGVCLETKEWKRSLGQKYKGSHVDWWLYKEATPWEYFTEVIIDEYGKLIENK